MLQEVYIYWLCDMIVHTRCLAAFHVLIKGIRRHRYDGDSLCVRMPRRPYLLCGLDTVLVRHTKIHKDEVIMPGL